MRNCMYIPKWMELLSCIGPCESRTKLTRKTNTTISYGCIIINKLIKKGFVVKNKRIGRSIPLKLTPKGKKLQVCILELKQKNPELLEVKE